MAMGTLYKIVYRNGSLMGNAMVDAFAPTPRHLSHDKKRDHDLLARFQ